MTKLELNILIEKVIGIRDRHRDVLSIEELDVLADMCNVIDHNIEVLREDEK